MCISALKARNFNVRRTSFLHILIGVLGIWCVSGLDEECNKLRPMYVWELTVL